MKKSLLVFNIMMLTILSFGQNQIVILNSTTHNTSGQYCGYWFYDDGDIGANYSNNQDYWITLQGNVFPNTHVRINFASFDIASDDTLYIYDGPSTASPLLSKHNNSYNPLTGANTMIQASLSNASGNLTVRLKTNGANTGAGWNSTILCGQICQSIVPQLDPNVFSPTVHLEDGFTYVDICFGDAVTFAALADSSVFPENNILYNQNAANCVFHWDFGDGSTADGQVVNHTYTAVNGYNVYLSITDSHGCVSTQQFYIRVRIAGEHIITVNPPSTLCMGDTLLLTSGSDPSSIVVTTANIATVHTEMYDSTTFIPDGPNCPQQCYGTPVTFNAFPAGAIIQSATDIESICMNIEHSFAGDLSFEIICPNGQSVVLDSYDNSGGSYLGMAEDINDGYPVCSASANPPGIGWTYCWSELYPQQGLLNNLDAGTSPIPATDTINYTGYITPENPLSGLIGCPLNGTWSIEICDNWGIDNGYIFNWTLTLQNQAQTAGWTYSVPIDSVEWQGYNFQNITDTTGYMVADSIGTFPYQTIVYDVFGCTYTANFNVEIVGIQGPILGPDINICSGTSTNLTAQGGQFYSWNTGGNTATISVNPLVTTTYTVSITGANGCTATDNITVNVIQTPVANAGTDAAVCFLTYQLQAVPSVGTGTWTSVPATAAFSPNEHVPNATATVTGNGVYTFTWTEDNTNGCVDSDAVVITFTQMPDANAGTDINICQLDTNLAAVPSVGIGTWTVSGPGVLLITDSHSATTYVSTITQGVYILTWTEDNGNGCIDSDNMILTLTNQPIANAGIRDSICSLSYPLQAVASFGTGTWTQSDGPGFSNFLVPHSATSNVTVSVYGDYYFIWTENNGNGCIDADTVLITFNYIPTSLFTVDPINCFGDDATVTYTGNGQLNVNIAQYAWTFTNANVISGTGYGPYEIDYSSSGTNNISLTVTQHGCVSPTTTIPVFNPTLLTLSLTKTDVTCNGLGNGHIFTTVAGGTPNYSYHWSNGSVFPSLGSVSPGNYTVTVTDLKGCTQTADTFITEPPKLVINAPHYIPICNGSDTIITASATGGIFPYSYLWDTGDNTTSITVSPDTTTYYYVIVTDANECTSQSNIEVFVYPPLTLTAIQSNDSVCPGESIIISLSASGGKAPYSYFINGDSTLTPVVLYPNVQQSYQILVKDGCNYTAQVDIPVFVYPIPPVSASSDIINGCTPLSVTFNESNPDEGQTYIWDFGDGESAYIKNPVHVFIQPGVFDVTLTITSIYGCKVTNFYEDWITAYPVPEALFEPNPPVANILKPIISFVNHSILAESVRWYFGDGDSSSVYSPIHRYPTYPLGIYDVTLIVFSDKGCSDTIYGKIEIQNELTFYAPTAFSPDKDDKNDMFFVFGNGIDLNTFHIYVYDRWGEVIFETTDMRKGWDGSVKGNKKAPVGIYTWLAKFNDFNGVKHEKTGAVTVIR